MNERRTEGNISRTRHPLPEREQQRLLRAQARVVAAETQVRRERASLARLVAALLEGGASRRAIGEVVGRAASNIHKLGKSGGK
jgi:hypothetical protein